MTHLLSFYSSFEVLINIIEMAKINYENSIEPQVLVRI